MRTGVPRLHRLQGRDAKGLGNGRHDEKIGGCIHFVALRPCKNPVKEPVGNAELAAMLHHLRFHVAGAGKDENDLRIALKDALWQPAGNNPGPFWSVTRPRKSTILLPARFKERIKGILLAVSRLGRLVDAVVDDADLVRSECRILAR